jgi:hypothetical protein
MPQQLYEIHKEVPISTKIAFDMSYQENNTELDWTRRRLCSNLAKLLRPDIKQKYVQDGVAYLNPHRQSPNFSRR